MKIETNTFPTKRLGCICLEHEDMIGIYPKVFRQHLPKIYPSRAKDEGS